MLELLAADGDIWAYDELVASAIAIASTEEERS
ncbi:hypothetical protein RLEG3_12710 [Rhizobium leguminosarum bv. trifolii WSM1689]|nr:hypothetical protein RLEG3_12710 [Rhizobium leguminosarum bv. trifolii WSM1689]